MEILDLYDNNFNKLNRTIIRRVDEIPDNSNIMLSYVLIKNNDKYLLGQSNKNNNYKWAVPGGHIISGETPNEGLERELKEELGINNIKYKLIDTIKYPYNNYIFNIFSTEDNIDIDSLILQSEEVLQIKWFAKDEILNMIDNDMINKGYAYILKEYM